MNQRVKLAALAACGLAAGASFAAVNSTRRIEDNGTKSAGLNIDGNNADNGGGERGFEKDVTKDASLIASTGADASSTAQMQQAGEQVEQADAKPAATTAQASQQQQG